jgi:hypothetical protein
MFNPGNRSRRREKDNPDPSPKKLNTSDEELDWDDVEEKKEWVKEAMILIIRDNPPRRKGKGTINQIRVLLSKPTQPHSFRR